MRNPVRDTVHNFRSRLQCVPNPSKEFSLHKGVHWCTIAVRQRYCSRTSSRKDTNTTLEVGTPPEQIRRWCSIKFPAGAAIFIFSVPGYPRQLVAGGVKTMTSWGSQVPGYLVPGVPLTIAESRVPGWSGMQICIPGSDQARY
eukprot:59624-Rhodomonas_salina.2